MTRALRTTCYRIGREQRVDAVLEGKIQKAPGRVRVTVQLLQVADGRALWAQTFDQPAEDLFAIQDAISIRVADALRVTLNPADRTRLAQRGTSHLDAVRGVRPRPVLREQLPGRQLCRQRCRIPAGDRDRPGLCRPARRAGSRPELDRIRAAGGAADARRSKVHG